MYYWVNYDELGIMLKGSCEFSSYFKLFDRKLKICLCIIQQFFFYAFSDFFWYGIVIEYWEMFMWLILVWWLTLQDKLGTSQNQAPPI